jgi:hypothetical protein
MYFIKTKGFNPMQVWSTPLEFQNMLCVPHGHNLSLNSQLKCPRAENERQAFLINPRTHRLPECNFLYRIIQFAKIRKYRRSDRPDSRASRNISWRKTSWPRWHIKLNLDSHPSAYLHNSRHWLQSAVRAGKHILRTWRYVDFLRYVVISGL